MKSTATNNVFNVGSLKYGDYADVIKAFLWVKKAALKARLEMGKINEEQALPLIKACDRLMSSSVKDLFTGCIYGGSKDVLNAEIDSAILREIPKENLDMCRKELHLSLSVNACTATASEIVRHLGLKKLILASEHFTEVLLQKAKAFQNVEKLGRLGLRDYLPTSLGDQFLGYASGMQRLLERLKEDYSRPIVSLIGSDEIGTTNNSNRVYASHAAQKLSLLLQWPVQVAENFNDRLIANDSLMLSHAIAQAVSVQVWRVAHDIRLMCSGPRGGLQEITVPAVAPGSSIMPGKLNPVIAEMVFTTVDQVDANHTGLVMAMKSGWLEGGNSSFVPLRSFINSTDLLARTMISFADLCIQGITANEKRCSDLVNRSLALVLLVKNKIGEQKAKEVVKLAIERDCTVKEAYLALHVLPETEISKIFSAGGNEPASSEPFPEKK
ncbi:MAG TPA: hypothetical protein IAC66_01235 [Candidatus Aphodousia gallistercoris]|nr:hypothetical protein [Candidatus Aphodousia gallistercoris]